MATEFRKGQKVVCIHYKKQYVCIIDSVDGETLWVTDSPKLGSWYGPKSWFKAVSE
jgi:hypothetical protein